MTASEHYAERLAAREAALKRLDQVHARIGTARLLMAGLFVVLAWIYFATHGFAAGWLLPLVISFAGAVFYHSEVQSRRARAARAIAFCREGLERIQDRWHGRGPTGSVGDVDVQHHVYATDLDLFGQGGLFQLLCAARTHMGRDTLTRWLLTPAGSADICARQAGVIDLRTRRALREDLAIDGETADIDVKSRTILEWAGAPNELDGHWVRWTAPLLVAAAVATGALWAGWGLSSPFLGVFVIEAAIAYRLKKPIHDAIAGIENANEELKALAGLLRRIEQEDFAAAPLRALLARLSSQAASASASVSASGSASASESASASASATLSKLGTIVNFVEARRNPFLAPLMTVLMYPIQVALAAERWRKLHGPAVVSWLAVLGEMEALVSLARYSDEHPLDPFPEFVEGPARFEAVALGHPLIPAAVRICNDVTLAGRTRLLLVSGSNMSGKSTLLRTVGINTVLAMAGAPVRAARLRLSPLQVGASIRVNDSLQEGSSRFYAEITRLRQLFEPSELPLLFLLDELLQGTNSADRRIGAEGVVKALVLRGAIGLISTHDLALTELAGLPDGAIENVHFQDELENGVLTFDFHLRPGIVTKSNGIELMRSIGLEV